MPSSGKTSSKKKTCTHGTSHYLIYILLLSLWFTGAVGFLHTIGNVLSGGVEYLGNMYCSGIKCCGFHLNDKETVERRLSFLLDTNLYGQHIAQDLILEAVKIHVHAKPVKALGIGLHGWTGTGKNYVSQMIAESVYKKGVHSPLVHVFAGKASFPVDSDVDTYKKNLIGWIRGNMTQCPHSMFIFDECDKFPETLLDVMRPFLDYHAVIEGVDYRHGIFLFLTNTGGSAIGKRMLEMHEEGIIRDDLKFEDFHHEIALNLFNQEGGFYKSDIVRGDGIDFHIPFLPMEEKHVRMCVMHSFEHHGISHPSEDMVQKVMDNMQFGPDSNPVFSVTGCKHVHALIIGIIARLKFEL